MLQTTAEYTIIREYRNCCSLEELIRRIIHHHVSENGSRKNSLNHRDREVNSYAREHRN